MLYPSKTISELYENLQEVVALCLESEKKFFGDDFSVNRIIGFQICSLNCRNAVLCRTLLPLPQKNLSNY